MKLIIPSEFTAEDMGNDIHQSLMIGTKVKILPNIVEERALTVFKNSTVDDSKKDGLLAIVGMIGTIERFECVTLYECYRVDGIKFYWENELYDLKQIIIPVGALEKV
jgi:hypothetical protein